MSRARALGLSWADATALLAVLLWGLNFPITKQVMTLLPPIQATFLRSATSALVYLAMLLVSGQWRLPRREDVPRLLFVSLCGQALNAVLYAFGLHLTSASHAGLIYTLTPLLVFATSHLAGYLRLTRRDLVGLGFGLAGAGLIVGAPLLSGREAGGATLLGDLLTATAAFIWGLWMLLATPLLVRYGTVRATGWITATAALGLLPLALPGLLAEDWASLPPAIFSGLAYSGLISGALGGLLWYGAVRRIGAARTAIYANLQSFFAVLFAALLLGERVEGTALVGGVAVVAAVLLTRRPAGEARREPRGVRGRAG